MTDKPTRPARRQPKRSSPAPREPAVPEADASEPAEAEGLEPAETLREAEDEIGINEWLDADTGEPAEGQSPPHIEPE
jgi:hypothetical protein